MTERHSPRSAHRCLPVLTSALPAPAAAASVLLAVLLAAPPALAQRGAASQAVQAARQAFHGPDLDGKNGPFAKVGMDLARLYYEARQGGAAVQGAGVDPAQTLLPVQDGHVRIDAVASESASALHARLDALGLKRGATAGPIVSGWLPIEALAEAAQLDALRFAHPSLAKVHGKGTTRKEPRGGGASGAGGQPQEAPVISQGVEAMRAAEARVQFGVDGSGILVGVLSDSFNCLGGAGGDEQAGEIPSDVLLTEEPDCESGTDEGRAMVQLIFDVAPGADQRFTTAFGGIATFANGICRLGGVDDTGVCEGVDNALEQPAGVIVDDVIYFAEPMFAVGQIAQAVNVVFDRGAAYFSSAGNSNGQSYESDDGFRNSGQAGPLAGGPLHDFNSGSGTDPFQSVTLQEGVTGTISLQWPQPYASTSTNSPGASSDLDLVLVDQEGNEVASATFDNIGNDPVEVLQYENDGSVDADGNGVADTTFQVGIELVDGPPPEDLLKIVYTNLTRQEYTARHSTVYGHANARGAEAVGAAPYFCTPPFNQAVSVEDGRVVIEEPGCSAGSGLYFPAFSNSIIESFSALGGTPIFFGRNGNRLPQPRVPRKPEIVAPDGTNNTFFGNDLGTTFDNLGDGDDQPNFFGTSAAAPHAAGVAALMRGLNADMAPTRIYRILQNTAADMDDPSTAGFDEGFDFKTGFGFVNALAALEEVPNNLGVRAEIVTADGQQQVELAVTTEQPAAAERFIIARCFGTRSDCGAGGGDFERINTVEATGDSTFTFTASVNNPGTYTFLVRQVNSDGTENVRTVQVTVELAEGATFALTEAFPNPFQNRAQVRLVVGQGQTIEVTARLYDTRGRHVRTIFEGEVEGQEAIPLDAGSLASGVYFIRVESEDFMETRSVVLVR